MYINRSTEEIFKVANLAVSIQFFDNLIEATIKEVAEEYRVSEKQVHFWKNRLLSEGPKIFSSLKPGRRKEGITSLEDNERLLVYETVNHLLVEGKRHEGINQKFTPEFKEKILKERDRLKEEHSISYEDFYMLMGISPRSVRDWAGELRQEGLEGLKDKTRAPKISPKKLADEIIQEIQKYGIKWKRRYGRISLVDFGARFRWEYQRLLAGHGRSNLSDKTIGRYLKDSGLYKGKEERDRGKRGGFRYYFPGAQVLIDTTVVGFFGIKAKVIGVMDAISRKIFHQEGFLSEKADKVIKSLKAGVKRAGRLGIKVISVVSDHGRSYKAKKVWEYLKGEGIVRIFSAPYWPEGKAALERYFRTLKEGIGKRRKIVLLIKGFLLWLKERIGLICLNLVLIGFNSEYEKKKGIDGKRLTQNVSPEYKEATRKVFEAEERESELKVEIISSVCKEFGFGMKIEKVKKYLRTYRKEIIEKAAEALRKKLVMEELEPKNRWYYLSKVVENLEKERKEAELVGAKRLIQEEKFKAEEREKIEKFKEEQRWYDSHPEEALEEAIEWEIVMHDNQFGSIHYDKEITKNLNKLLMKHTSLTAGVRVEKLCQRIQEKEKLGSKNVIKSGFRLPSGEKLQEAKEKVIRLIRRGYRESKGAIPIFKRYALG